MIDDRPVTQSTQVWHHRDGNWKDVPWGQRQSAVKLGDCFYQVLNRNSKAIIAAFAAHGRTPPRPVTVNKIEMDGTVKPLDPAQGVKLGPYSISLDCDMVTDCEGTVYALCDEASQGTRKLGPGVLVYHQSGKAYYVPSKDDTELTRRGYTFSKVWVDGKRAWLSATLYDMQKLTQVDHLPAADLNVIAATDDCVSPGARRASSSAGRNRSWSTVRA